MGEPLVVEVEVAMIFPVARVQDDPDRMIIKIVNSRAILLSAKLSKKSGGLILKIRYHNSCHYANPIFRHLRLENSPDKADSAVLLTNHHLGRHHRRL